MNRKGKFKSRKNIFKNLSKRQKKILFIPTLAFLIQVFLAVRIQGYDWFAASGSNSTNGLGLLLDNGYAPPNAWLGADGESYLRGLQGLSRDGLFSTDRNLSYWPAGYPLLLWPLFILFQGHFFLSVSVFQSFYYAFACGFFLLEIDKTRIGKLTFALACFLVFNPTLALNTIAIGYEVPVASCIILCTASIMRVFRLKNEKSIRLDLGLFGLSSFVAIIMQPRSILFILVLIICWRIAIDGNKFATLTTIFLMSIVALAPTTLILRNLEANGYPSISTNLGTTMSIGAGSSSSGGYGIGNTNVACPKAQESIDAASADSEMVKCVLKWYFDNPQKSSILFLNKAKFFWSPWFGPEANGTMARNPWLINHPFNSVVSTPGGKDFVYGSIGQAISWLWMLSGLFLMGLGFTRLLQLGGIERVVGLVALALIIINMLTSMATIGDHRFRIPTLGLSLVLQAIGLLTLGSRKNLIGSTGAQRRVKK